MAVITITTPGGAIDARIADAFAGSFGWTATLPDGSPNVTKAQFVKVRLVQHIKDVVAAFEASAAADTARAAAAAAAASQITAS